MLPVRFCAGIQKTVDKNKMFGMQDVPPHEQTR